MQLVSLGEARYVPLPQHAPHPVLLLFPEAHGWHVEDDVATCMALK